MEFVIFDRVRVNTETQSIHPIFTNLLVSIVSGIELGAMRFEAETNRPSPPIFRAMLHMEHLIFRN